MIGLPPKISGSQVMRSHEFVVFHALKASEMSPDARKKKGSVGRDGHGAPTCLAGWVGLMRGTWAASWLFRPRGQSGTSEAACPYRCCYASTTVAVRWMLPGRKC